MIQNNIRGLNFQTTPKPVDVKQILGAGLAADWRQAFIACGFGWHVDTLATFVTPITGGGNGTTLDFEQPEMGISVPAGFTLVPLRVALTANAGVQTTDGHVTEAALILDRTAAYAGGTVVSRTPINLRTNKTTGCPATCFSAATADITGPVLSAALMTATKRTNFGTNVGCGVDGVELVYDPTTPPFLVGPCAIYGYFGGTIAVTGYGMADFLAIPSELVATLTR